MDNKSFVGNLARKLNCDAATASRLIEGLGTILREQCGEGNRVAFPGFGTFEGVKHNEEVTTDLATGRRMLLPPSMELRFVAGSMLKKKIKEGTV